MPATFQFFNPAAKVTITHGHLPHWDQANASYFITWRTADSIPREIWLRWREKRDAWLLAHDINPAAKDWRFDFENARRSSPRRLSPVRPRFGKGTRRLSR
jgi:putative transposase